MECELDSLYFNRYFFKQRMAAKFLVNPHHLIMAATLDKVVSGEISRLIINMPPGYTKTEMAVVGFIARGLALNCRARFMHLSYSGTLALLSSSSVRGIVRSSEYQAMWPMALRSDADSKSLWWNEHGGGLYAATIAGQVTGFRAGHMEEGFSGALIIDDPVKPKDSLSKTIREGINDDYSETVKSRLAIESIPVILVMQRIHYNDLSGYLLRGGSGEMWHHLNLPMKIGERPYPEENTHAIHIEHDLPNGWLWPFKHNDIHEAALKSHRRYWDTQALQAPKRFNAEGALWTETMITDAQEMAQPWQLKRRVVAVDPAVSDDETSDDTGIVVCSEYTDDNFSVEADHTVNDTTDAWADKVIWCYEHYDCDAVVVETNNGGDLVETVLRLKKFTGRVIAVHASKGKFARAEPISALYAQKRVKHATTGDFGPRQPEQEHIKCEGDLYDYEGELLEYVPSESKRSPNRLDAGVWGLTELSNPQQLAGVWGR